MSTIATSGRSSSDRVHERVAVADRRDDVEAVVAQEPRQAVAQQREILGDHDPHGITALIVVGPPAGLDDVERAVERLDAAREAAEPAAGRIGAALAVVDDLDDERVAASRTMRCRPARRSRACRRSRAPRRRRSRRRSRPAAAGRSSTSTATSTLSGVRSASAAIAASRPRSASTGGWMPRARSRSSASASRAPRRASASSCCAAAGSDSNFCSARPRLMPSATRRACAPSCRSRSIRRSSVSCWSTAPARSSRAPRCARAIAPGESRRGASRRSRPSAEHRPQRARSTRGS